MDNVRVGVGTAGSVPGYKYCTAVCYFPSRPVKVRSLHGGRSKRPNVEAKVVRVDDDRVSAPRLSCTRTIDRTQ